MLDSRSYLVIQRVQLCPVRRLYSRTIFSIRLLWTWKKGHTSCWKTCDLLYLFATAQQLVRYIDEHTSLPIVLRIAAKTWTLSGKLILSIVLLESWASWPLICVSKINILSSEKKSNTICCTSREQATLSPSALLASGSTCLTVTSLDLISWAIGNIVSVPT